MGYAGYAPGANSKMADKLTPLQQALRSLPLAACQDTLELIEKLTRNVVRNPSDDKFRRIKLSNAKIAAAIKDVPNALDLMKEMGWVVEESPDGECLVLPPSVRFVHESEVIAIIDAKDYYKSELEADRRRQIAARKAPDAQKEQLLRQMEADRKEKDAEGPITQGSKAQSLGNGPNIMRAGDIGIGQAAGG